MFSLQSGYSYCSFLSDNELCGDIGEIWEPLRDIRKLYAFRLFTAVMLTILNRYLGRNQFCGQIPEYIGNNLQLQELLGLETDLYALLTCCTLEI